MAKPEPLPTFRYHPEPVKSGSFIESATACKCCGKARGYVYTGSFYSVEDDLEESICPWCIADGKAAKEFDGMFSDEALFVGEVPAKIVKELTTRTPGFSSWQQEEWPTCCNDATAFIAPVGYAELQAEYDDWTYDVTLYIVNEMKIYNNEALDFLKTLNRYQGPTAYLFKCLQCGQNHAYIDFR